MIRRLLISGGLFAAAALNGQAAERPPRPATHHLAKANVLPLALDDSFEFRKSKLYLNDPLVNQSTRDKMLTFEQQRMNYGAVSQEERRERQGNYFTFWWRTQRPANLKVRLEYRQANLGAYVQAKEVEVAVDKGTHQSKFEVTGDDYNHDGRVLAWRAVLIEDGKIVALTQSFLWH